jgi:hypothetical protein
VTPPLGNEMQTSRGPARLRGWVARRAQSIVRRLLVGSFQDVDMGAASARRAGERACASRTFKLVVVFEASTWGLDSGLLGEPRKAGCARERVCTQCSRSEECGMPSVRFS